MEASENGPPEKMTCKICEMRRARRYCPGVGGDICALCCGTEREVTVSCPLDCPYLQEARKHDKPPEVDPSQWPNQDVRVTDQFLAEHYPLFAFLTGELLEAGLSTPGTADLDVREALDALIRTYRTRQSGLYYDSRPNNLLAASIYQRIQQRLEEFERKDREQHGLATVRDLDVLGILVFLQRLERQRNNGRRRGRAFLDFLRSIPALRREVEGSEEPRLILP